MNYTIASFDQVQGSLKIDISKSGNRYDVAIWDEDYSSSTTKTFDTLQEAYKVFEKLVSWCVFGFYSNDAKKKFLQTGTMD